MTPVDWSEHVHPLLELWDLFVVYAAGFAMGRNSSPAVKGES